MPADRSHDVSSLTAAQLERAKRDLEISLALAFPGSPVRVSIVAEMTAIDAELAERAAPDDSPVLAPVVVDSPCAQHIPLGPRPD